MLSRVDRFVTLSTFERRLYSQLFHLPQDRFDVVLWGVKPPEVESPETSFEPGEYVCAIGSQARDYVTLVNAARLLPQIRFVLVVRPYNLPGLDIPSNVTVHVNLPEDRSMNILMHSRFMALPLRNSQTPCGHRTLVAAMNLGKAYVVSDSASVSDYVDGGNNGLTVPPGSAEDFAAAILRLWNEPALCQRLGETGRRFAQSQCSEQQMVLHFRRLLSTLASRNSLRRGVVP